ncbi:MAG TPA: hypothetical protein VES61_02785 [Gaiellaceae bacterium]|nr:hypothetical protein [Gaiellaceae bacterium]
MRAGLLALAVVAAIGIAGCGGSESAEPLTLAQRVPGEAEAPGSKPDPVETRRAASGFDEFKANLVDQLIEPSAEEMRKFEKAGFVSGILDTRFFPFEPGAAHTGHEPHVVTLVLEFESEDGANDAIAVLHRNGLKPCPEGCAADLTEFDVDGVPDATGVRAVATAADIEATGEPGEPYDSYAIRFADGPFAYDIELFGAPGKVSEKQAEEIANKLYDRVGGSPPKP